MECISPDVLHGACVFVAVSQGLACENCVDDATYAHLDSNTVKSQAAILLKKLFTSTAKATFDLSRLANTSSIQVKPFLSSLKREGAVR